MAGSAAASDQTLRGSVEVGKDRNGLDIILLRNPKGDTVEVSCHGGQVLSWKTERGEELLFMSSNAVFKPPHPVRGGIPICFPQFDTQETLGQRGFAMKRLWTIDRDPPPLPETGITHVDLLLEPSEVDFKFWPHKFKFHLRVALADDGSLILISRVWNICSKPFTFTFAYHTYLAVSDIGEVRVEGLEVSDYLVNLKERVHSTEQGVSLSFDSEVDRIYVEAGGVVEVLDHKSRRTLKIYREGLPDVVVWNPWDKKSKAMADFGNNDYKRMVSVDGAAIEKPTTLKPGEEWRGRLKLTLTLSTEMEGSSSSSRC